MEINNKINEIEKQFEAGTLTEEEMRIQRESLNATRNNMKVEFSEVASAQLANTGVLKGGEQAYTGSTLGSWVLVNATTAKQEHCCSFRGVDPGCKQVNRVH